MKKRVFYLLAIFVPILGACSQVDTQKTTNTNSSAAETKQSESTTASIHKELPEGVEEILKLVESSSGADRTTFSTEIYTPSYSGNKRIYVIKTTEIEGKTSYYLYVSSPEKFITIDENEYNGKRQGIIQQNNSEEPYYQENN